MGKTSCNHAKDDWFRIIVMPLFIDVYKSIQRVERLGGHDPKVHPQGCCPRTISQKEILDQVFAFLSSIGFDTYCATPGLECEVITRYFIKSLL